MLFILTPQLLPPEGAAFINIRFANPLWMFTPQGFYEVKMSMISERVGYVWYEWNINLGINSAVNFGRAVSYVILPTPAFPYNFPYKLTIKINEYEYYKYFGWVGGLEYLGNLQSQTNIYEYGTVKINNQWRDLGTNGFRVIVPTQISTLI